MVKMKQATMLYKHPGKHFLRGHGGSFDYIVVDKCDEKVYDDALANGWCESTTEALTASKGKAGQEKDEADAKVAVEAKEIEEKVAVEAKEQTNADAKAAVEKSWQRRTSSR